MTTWVKINDNLPGHRKIRTVSPEARWAYVASICYAGQNQTDGFIPEGALTLVDATRRIATALVAAGLWEATDGGWQIHDYLEYNRSQAKVKEISKVRANAGQIGRAAQLANAGQTPGKLQDKARANAGQLDLSASDSASVSPDHRDPRGQSQIGQTPGKLPSDTAPIHVRERRDTLLMALPRKYQADPVIFDEAELLAQDSEGDEILDAISVCRRDGVLCFPRNVRERIPRLREQQQKAASKPAQEPIRFITGLTGAGVGAGQ